MQRYAVFDDATGMVLKTGKFSNPDDLPGMAGEGQTAEADPPEGVVDELWIRASDGSYSERVFMPATLDGMTITGIPEGAVLTIEGIDYTINDGEAELSFTLPGTYQVKLSLWPWLDTTFEVIAP